MRWLLALALPLLLQPASPPVDLEVQADAGHVVVRARGIQLARILERFGKVTGMKVVYEAGPPAQIVSATVDAASEREALTRILEGLGVSYAFRMDASGARVEMLLITGAGGGAAPPRAAALPPAARMLPEPLENPATIEEPIPEGIELSDDVPSSPPFADAPEFPHPDAISPPAIPPPGMRPSEVTPDLPRPEFPKPISNPFSPP